MEARSKASEDKAAALQTARQQAYSALKGQREIFLLGYSQLALTNDKNTFYTIRATVAAQPNSHFSPYKQAFENSAAEQEKLSDNRLADLITTSQKISEDLGLVEVSFTLDQRLRTELSSVDKMLLENQRILPKQSFPERINWVQDSTDPQLELALRAEKRMPGILQSVKPLTDLLDDLKRRLQDEQKGN